MSDENPHYRFGSYPPPPRDFDKKLLEYIKYFNNAYTSSDLLYLVLETLLSIHKNRNIAAWDYQQYVTNSDRLFLKRAEAKITSMTNKIMYHIQRIITEERADYSGTATASAPIASGPTPISTFPESPFSDTPGDHYILLSTLTYENPVEEPTSVSYYVPSDFPPSGESFSLPSPIPNELSTEEPTFPSEIPTEVPTLVLYYEPNKFYLGGEPSRFPYPITTEITTEEPTLPYELSTS